MKKIKVTTMGGGTGNFTVLSGIKKYKNLDLAAIVSMCDDGGSSGRLRDELGVLPSGDIRQCLVALSEAPLELRDLFNYRFENGGLGGHSFGNIFISTLEKLQGDLNSALIILKKILKIKGDVIPVTLDDIKLLAKLNNGDVVFGEHQINTSPLMKNKEIKNVSLNKRASINEFAKNRILESDFIIIGPGNLYCSLVPLFLVDGVSDALNKTKAKVIYIVNLMNKFYHTYDYDIFKFVDKIEEYVGENILDAVIFNNKKPSESLLKKYAREGSYTKFPDRPLPLKYKGKLYLGANILKNHTITKNPYDKVERSFIRHNPDKIAKILKDIFENKI